MTLCPQAICYFERQLIRYPDRLLKLLTVFNRLCVMVFSEWRFGMDIISPDVNHKMMPELAFWWFKMYKKSSVGFNLVHGWCILISFFNLSFDHETLFPPSGIGPVLDDPWRVEHLTHFRVENQNIVTIGTMYWPMNYIINTLFYLEKLV